jgi:caspase 2
MVSYDVHDVVLCIFKGNNHLLNEFGDTHVRIFLYSLQDMKRKIRDFAQRREHSRYDSCLVAIMSHGIARSSKQNSTIISADGQLLEIDWVLEQFNNDNAHSLVAKPKIFFFQTCRCGMALKFMI